MNTLNKMDGFEFCKFDFSIGHLVTPAREYEDRLGYIVFSGDNSMKVEMQLRNAFSLIGVNHG